MNKHIVTPRLGLSVLAISSVLLLGACSKSNEPTTAGEKVDAAISTVEKKSEAVGQDMKQGMEAAKAGTAEAVETVKAETQDAAITTKVTAELARDPELSALKIDVDTNAGTVVLKGTAPTEAAKDRAVT
ncbi:MAG TPA: BON domain-containing protein, partial [Burkholderiaceae bacterium]|nr:BON domain-containing protein [Burkholderiaceae bacterium]